MNETIQLQSYGHAPAKAAGELKEGDITIWNFGVKSEVSAIIRETEKCVWVAFHGKCVPVIRKFLKTRLVAVA
jgi:hypothetical protein